MRFLKTVLRSVVLVLVSGLAVPGCSREAARPLRSSDSVGGDPESFVNRVWEVESSPSVAPGTWYAFLSEGTLLVTSPNSTPLLGTWRYEGGMLTMTEEGLPYQVTIRRLTAEEFDIAIANPGTPVEIRLVPANVSPLPE